MANQFSGSSDGGVTVTSAPVILVIRAITEALRRDILIFMPARPNRGPSKVGRSARTVPPCTSIRYSRFSAREYPPAGASEHGSVTGGVASGITASVPVDGCTSSNPVRRGGGGRAGGRGAPGRARGEREDLPVQQRAPGGLRVAEGGVGPRGLLHRVDVPHEGLDGEQVRGGGGGIGPRVRLGGERAGVGHVLQQPAAQVAVPRADPAVGGRRGGGDLEGRRAGGHD